METSAAAACLSCVAPSSSCLFSPFSDQSHVEFYRCSTSLSSPSLCLRSSSSRSSLLPPSIPPLRTLCYSAVVMPVLEPPQEPSLLLKELADLKLQMKQKKKELKAHKREEKKRSKMQLKEEKKAMMNGVTEGKKKKMKNCSSESSSSSESSDEGCESMSMRVLRKERSLLECTQPGVVQNGLVEGDTGVSAKIQVTDSMPVSCQSSCSGAMVFVSEISESRVMNEGEGDAYEKDILNKRLLLLSQSLAPVFPSLRCANKIEVCAGGKCKKAGSEQLLSAFRAQIPASSNVEAVPCKCMGKCSAAMNVKIHKEDTNPQIHSQVRVEDANLILNHHFGLGRALSGLPAIPSDDKAKTPSPLSAPMVCGV